VLQALGMGARSCRESQGRGVPTVPITRLGIGRDRAEWKVNNGYNHMLISIH
jgi:hypothetical protein